MLCAVHAGVRPVVCYSSSVAPYLSTTNISTENTILWETADFG